MGGVDGFSMTGSSIGLENPDVAKALQAQLDVIGAALDASKDGFAIWKAIPTPDGSIEEFELVLMNSAGAAAAGKPQQELVGRTLTAVVGAETAKDLRGIFVRALREGQGVREVVPGFSPEFGHGLYENTVVPFGDNLVFATYRDVSDAEKERSRLLWLSEHDFLTGMPNRAKLQDSLASSIAAAVQKGTLMAFVFIDIDYFKNVNDTYGHDVGDVLLVNFVKRIRHSLPERALVARIAGDEFAILLEEIKHEAHLRDLMQEVFEAMQRPFVYGDIEMSITCSAGCVVSDGSEQVDELMRIADKAMYQAKHQGRARFTVEKAIKTT
jgi:diguanylate cyclase (GGDEF)-like protein